MSRVLLTGGRIVDPDSGWDERGDVLIIGDRIASIEPLGNVMLADRTINCAGRLVVPGLIDLHAHLREPPCYEGGLAPAPAETPPEPDEPPETVASGAAAAVAGGFTTLCAMPNTRPPIDSAEAVAWYERRAAEAGLAHVLAVGCLTHRREGREPADLEGMYNAGAIAFSDDGADIADDALFDRVLREAARLASPVFCHCENKALAEGGVINDGPLATALGLPGIPRDAEDTAVQRACDAARRTGCHVHICHVSTEGAVEIIRKAKAAGAPVTAEATPHHLTLTDEALTSRESVFKVSPPLRTGHDVDAVLAGVCDGTIDCLATDHAPHTASAKARGLAAAPAGMIGLESALPIYVQALVETGRLTWLQLIARLTTHAADVLASEAGTLAVRAPADVTVIDPEARWTIDPATFASRSRNCPFAGWTVRARAVMTLVSGKIVYEHKR